MQALLVEDDYVSSAALFTARKYALAGHLRRHNGATFIHHPRELAVLLSKLPHNREMLAAAWLTRSMQDDYADSDEVEMCFGQKVADMVSAMRSFNLPDSGAPETLAQTNFPAIQAAPALLQTMALADMFVLAQTVTEFESGMLPGFSQWLARHLPLFPQASSALIQMVERWLVNQPASPVALHQVS
ncbi:HD domain-containing protein [Alteromonas sp. RKMC-009]|uniref:HD domain-containing protein n=1 Tax=Alteromonas sp. RKMC-009 TaxID=2267264 RepID=UPI000E6858B1|nr:HD domain-containing protein [Alteromonas sp. RKMC-009]AYA65420.1 HD domain-containing protein [Alteromonas sp. RKMC-009]